MLSVVLAAAVALQPARLRNAATTRLHAANIQYGDTGGAALVLDDLSVRRGPVELVSGATWTIMPGERWGIVGPNGAGKSTLLGAILGIHDMTTGHVAVKTDADVGYLEQTGVGGSDTSVRTEVMSRMGALAEAQTALTEATARVEGGDYSEEALEALGEAQTQFEEKGGYTAEETVSKVLGGLGFDVKKDLDRPCSDFSGGWQMRIALARLLLSGPDVLFLDEPTNHLDSAARAWLAEQGRGEEIWGPMNSSIWQAYRFMTQGFERPIFFGEPYNPDYYPRLWTDYGFERKAGWYSWDLSRAHLDGMHAASLQRRSDVLTSGDYRYDAFQTGEHFDRDLKRAYDVLVPGFSKNLAYTHLDFPSFAQVYGGMRAFVVGDVCPFLVNPEGTVVKHYESVNPETHTQDVIADLERFQAE